jgi:TPR repeat protein
MNHYFGGNIKDAVANFKVAASKNNPDAETMLGTCYLNGFGLPKDEGMAAHWFEKAAYQNVASAQRLLAKCYYKKADRFPNQAYCYMWINLAAWNGDEKAIKMREELDENFPDSAVRKGQELSTEWLNKYEQNTKNLEN